eukprot:7333866-Alexandrium_andersonii.AAC.1
MTARPPTPRRSDRDRAGPSAPIDSWSAMPRGGQSITGRNTCSLAGRIPTPSTSCCSIFLYFRIHLAEVDFSWTLGGFRWVS